MKKIILAMFLSFPLTLLAEGKIIEYRMCESFQSEGLTECVNEALANGYELYGDPVAMITRAGNGSRQYHQAVVKRN